MQQEEEQDHLESGSVRILREGKVSLAVPPHDEPRMLPAFFNAKAKFVRDVSIACYNSFVQQNGQREVTFADSLAGVGARGLRVAVEVDAVRMVYLNDINSLALAFARKTASLNHLEPKCYISNKEACSFLVSREPTLGERFDIVDADPFGSPANFVDCAIRAVKDGGLVSLSATDSAVLCGVYPTVARMKYLGASLRTDYCHEMGMRLLFGLLSQTAERFEIGIDPIFCHHDAHYFRTYAIVHVGNRHARQSHSHLGYVLHCFHCGYRKTVSLDDFDSNDLYCPDCRNADGKEHKLKVGGPCWIGRIQSQSFVKTCASQSGMGIFDPNEQVDIPLYFDIDWICETMHIRTPRISDVLKELRSNGFPSSRTCLNPKGVRSLAPLPFLRSVVKHLASMPSCH